MHYYSVSPESLSSGAKLHLRAASSEPQSRSTAAALSTVGCPTLRLTAAERKFIVHHYSVSSESLSSGTKLHLRAAAIFVAADAPDYRNDK